MKGRLLLLIACLITINVYAQMHTNQNGIKTTVTNNLATPDARAVRFEIATIGYNSFHWQTGRIIIIELFNISYGTGYAKYIIENGYGQGAGFGSPKLRLVSNYGAYHDVRLSFGMPVDLGTNYAAGSLVL